MYTSQSKIKRLLRNVPEELYDILVPRPYNIPQLEEAYTNLQRWEKKRGEIIALQKEHDLPFEPNSTMTRVKMKLRLKKRLESLRKIPGIDQGNDPE